MKKSDAKTKKQTRPGTLKRKGSKDLTRARKQRKGSKDLTRPRKQRGKAPAPESGSDLIDPPEFVYKVACLAWKRGLSANSIAKELDAPGDAAMITKVKRALQKAADLGILVLHPPKAQRYREVLEEKWKHVQFTVVPDDLLANDDSVHIAASEAIAGRISELWNKAESQVVVANAGGHAVSESIRCLQRIAPILDPHPEKRLVFISLNSAGRARGFQRSSNYLTVRISDIYRGEHIAVLGPADMSVDESYRKLSENIDLLVCGAGGPNSLLVQRAQEEGIQVPSEMVGDIAFIPLDERGREIRHPGLQAIVENHLHAAPPYSEILRIAGHPPRTVLVVLSGESKFPVALAILRGGLASHVVLDVPLAKRLASAPVR